MKVLIKLSNDVDSNLIWSVPSMHTAPERNIWNSRKVFPNGMCRQKLHELRKRCWLKMFLIIPVCMSTCTLYHKLTYLHIGIWIFLVHCVSVFYIYGCNHYSWNIWKMNQNCQNWRSFADEKWMSLRKNRVQSPFEKPPLG